MLLCGLWVVQLGQLRDVCAGVPTGHGHVRADASG